MDDKLRKKKTNLGDNSIPENVKTGSVPNEWRKSIGL